MLLDFHRPPLKGGGALSLDAGCVESVEDLAVTGHKVCQITMSSGDRHLVEGTATEAATRIREAQERMVYVLPEAGNAVHPAREADD